MDKQNKQRKKLVRSVGLNNLKETKGGISTNISVRQALSVLKDEDFPQLFFKILEVSEYER